MNECSDFFIVPTSLPECFIGSKLRDDVLRNLLLLQFPFRDAISEMKVGCKSCVC